MAGNFWKETSIPRAVVEMKRRGLLADDTTTREKLLYLLLHIPPKVKTKEQKPKK